VSQIFADFGILCTDSELPVCKCCGKRTTSTSYSNSDESPLSWTPLPTVYSRELCTYDCNQYYQDHLSSLDALKSAQEISPKNNFLSEPELFTSAARGHPALAPEHILMLLKKEAAHYDGNVDVKVLTEEGKSLGPQFTAAKQIDNSEVIASFTGEVFIFDEEEKDLASQSKALRDGDPLRGALNFSNVLRLSPSASLIRSTQHALLLPSVASLGARFASSTAGHAANARLVAHPLLAIDNRSSLRKLGVLKPGTFVVITTRAVQAGEVIRVDCQKMMRPSADEGGTSGPAAGEANPTIKNIAQDYNPRVIELTKKIVRRCTEPIGVVAQSPNKKNLKLKRNLFEDDYGYPGSSAMHYLASDVLNEGCYERTNQIRKEALEEVQFLMSRDFDPAVASTCLQAEFKIMFWDILKHVNTDAKKAGTRSHDAKWTADDYYQFVQDFSTPFDVQLSRTMSGGLAAPSLANKQAVAMKDNLGDEIDRLEDLVGRRKRKKKGAADDDAKKGAADDDAKKAAADDGAKEGAADDDAVMVDAAAAASSGNAADASAAAAMEDRDAKMIDAEPDDAAVADAKAKLKSLRQELLTKGEELKKTHRLWCGRINTFNLTYEKAKASYDAAAEREVRMGPTVPSPEALRKFQPKQWEKECVDRIKQQCSNQGGDLYDSLISLHIAVPECLEDLWLLASTCAEVNEAAKQTEAVQALLQFHLGSFFRIDMEKANAFSRECVEDWITAISLILSGDPFIAWLDSDVARTHCKDASSSTLTPAAILWFLSRLLLQLLRVGQQRLTGQFVLL
jgi:hypothetical protein